MVEAEVGVNASVEGPIGGLTDLVAVVASTQEALRLAQAAHLDWELFTLRV